MNIYLFMKIRTRQIFSRMYWSVFFVFLLFLMVGLGLIISKNIEEYKNRKTADSWSLIQKVKDFSSNIFNPTPLRFEGENKQSNLTTQGVLFETNRHRQTEGLKVLSFNAKLEESAKAKLEDMFTNNYFAHLSETGEGPAELAITAKYEYIVVGENLALGNFLDDKELLQAWMDSPGHRANIMNKNYRDIGIAVGKGIFEGEMTWLAVQEFGIPTSVCITVNESQEKLIISNKADLGTMDIEIKERDDELSKMSKESAEYRSSATAYNNLVEKYNVLVRRTKILVADYNKDVISYNNCIKEFNL